MIKIKNIKVNFALMCKGIGITCVAIANTFAPNAIAQEASCVNFWTNPNTGKNECFNGRMTVIAEPIPISYNSASDRYNVGGQQISIPNPESYVRVTPAMGAVYRLHKSAKDPYNKLLASYISQSEAEMAMRGELPASTRGFYLKVLKTVEKESATPQDFAQLKKMIKIENRKNKSSNLSKLQEIVDESSKSLSQELGVDLSFDVSEMIPLEPHYESSNTFSYSMYIVSKVSAMGEQTEYVMAGTLTLINVAGKVVSLYSYGTQADLEWTQKAGQVWADKAIASNL